MLSNEKQFPLSQPIMAEHGHRRACRYFLVSHVSEEIFKWQTHRCIITHVSPFPFVPNVISMGICIPPSSRNALARALVRTHVVRRGGARRRHIFLHFIVICVLIPSLYTLFCACEASPHRSLFLCYMGANMQPFSTQLQMQSHNHHLLHSDVLIG